MCLGELGYAGIFLAIIAVSAVITEIMARKNIVEKNTGRKLLHMTAGVLVSFLPHFITGKITLLIIGVVVLVSLYYLVANNKLEGIDDLHRKSWGIVFFPVSFILLILLFIPEKPEVFTISFLLMTFSDAFASIVGKKVKSREYHLTADKKSIAGSITFFLTTVILLAWFLFYESGLPGKYLTTLFIVSFILVVATISTLFEAISSDGFDNFSVPVGTAFLANMYFYPAGGGVEAGMLGGFIAAVVTGYTSYRLRFLTPDGAVGATILGTFVFGFGGVQWTLPVMTFFVLSSVLSKIRVKRNKEVEERFEKSGTRNTGQVIANGGVGGIILLIESYFNTGWLYPVYVLNFAAVCADTWGTEFGTMWKTKTISLKNFREVPQGLSGGVSLPGTAGALAGAVVVVISSYYWTGDLVILALLITLGFGGSLLDSLMGEFLQIQYKCGICGIVTERRSHCDTGTSRHKGNRYITNDVVNFSSAIASILIFVIIYKTWL